MAKKKPPAPSRKRESPFELAALVSERVQIADVRIAHCSARTLLIEDADESKIRVVNRVRVSFSTDEEKNRVLVRPHFTLTGVSKADETRQPVVEIECEFLLIYEAESVADFAPSNVEAFANINGLFNAWPYWREFVQNAIARMGLPRLTIPVFRFGE